MVFDLAAWAVILVVVLAIGSGVLAVVGANRVRRADRCIMATWIGTVILCSALLAASLFAPLTPGLSVGVAVTLAALGAGAARRARPRVRATRPVSVVSRSAIAMGVGALVVGAAAFASDPVTLYDSLVYHVGIIHWLREQGTVPGVALIHNRLGHVSSWFTLAAAFEWGEGSTRSANVPLGFALVIVGLQAAIAITRIAIETANRADWFLAITSSALIWAASAYGAATPSPDVATNTLIIMTAWSMVAVTEAETTSHPDNKRLIPLLLALGACAMKLFAVPALAAALLFAAMRSGVSAPPPTTTRAHVRRAAWPLAIAAIILGPFIAANIVASGCPAYPSPVACVDAPWSVGAAQASDYARYVRDVARWERRGTTSVGAAFGWVVPWVIAHPLVAALAVLSPAVGLHLLRRMPRGPGRDAASGIVALGTLGIAFAAWAAPAPRFLFASVLAIPALAVAVVANEKRARIRVWPVADLRHARIAFVSVCVITGFAYALASQKLNVRSAVASRARLVTLTDLMLPALPEAPARLYKWRVNDVDVYTPVPRPIADSLGYQSVIAFNAGFEKCSTAPLPCTPYLPPTDVQLRRPDAGLRGGFVRTQQPNLGSRVADCVVDLSPKSAADTRLTRDDRSDHVDRCRGAR